MPSEPAFAPYMALAYVVVEIASRGALMRWLGRHLCRALILMDLGIYALLRKIVRPDYEVRGQCDQRGVCCQHIVSDPPRWLKRGWPLRLYVAFHATWHNFFVVARGPNDEVIFSCNHLQSDGRCGIWRFRPRLCRDYPLRPIFGIPKVLPGCGFVVVPRRVAQMQRRPALRVLNPRFAVHHPTPPQRPPGELERPEDYHFVPSPPE